MTFLGSIEMRLIGASSGRFSPQLDLICPRRSFKLLKITKILFGSPNAGENGNACFAVEIDQSAWVSVVETE